MRADGGVVVIASLAAFGAAVATAGAFACRLRGRRIALSADMHELRQALAAARLMVDVLPLLGDARPDACAAASDELARAHDSVIDFEQRLHAPLWRRPHAGRQVVRPPRWRGVIDAQSEFERLALIWGQAAHALGRSLEFDWQAGAVAIAGARRNLTEAAANLLSNAIRHGEGRIRVSARECDGMLRVEIADQGPGLARSVAALAARRRSALRRLGPHGHGLAVAVRAVQRLGGEIASAPSAEGAVLVLKLPVASSRRRDGGVPSARSGSPGGRQPVGIRGDDQ